MQHWNSNFRRKGEVGWWVENEATTFNRGLPDDSDWHSRIE